MPCQESTQTERKGSLWHSERHDMADKQTEEFSLTARGDGEAKRSRMSSPTLKWLKCEKQNTRNAFISKPTAPANPKLVEIDRITVEI